MFQPFLKCQNYSRSQNGSHSSVWTFQINFQHCTGISNSRMNYHIKPDEHGPQLSITSVHRVVACFVELSLWPQRSSCYHWRWTRCPARFSSPTIPALYSGILFCIQTWYESYSTRSMAFLWWLRWFLKIMVMSTDSRMTAGLILDRWWGMMLHNLVYWWVASPFHCQRSRSAASESRLKLGVRHFCLVHDTWVQIYCRCDNGCPTIILFSGYDLARCQ